MSSEETEKFGVKRSVIQAAKCLKSYSAALQPTPSSVIQELKTAPRRNVG